MNHLHIHLLVTAISAFTSGLALGAVLSIVDAIRRDVRGYRGYFEGWAIAFVFFTIVTTVLVMHR